MFDIPEELKKLPHQPGVYLMKHGDEIIYVGKAVDLHNRVRQYFQSERGKSPKIRKMISLIQEFEYIVTGTESEALVLENNLIKEHRPPYNTMLKDDKQYPYIKATVQEAFPRVYSTRKIRQDGARYLGPYTNAGAVKESLELVQQIFRLRTCNRRLPEDIGKERPCLNYDIKRCMGPCTGRISGEEYREAFRRALAFLEGKAKDITDSLRKEMQDAAEVLDFERAAVIRDQIRNIEALESRQIVENAGSDEERDVIAYAIEEDHALAQVFFIRNGKLLGREHFFLDIAEGESGRELVRAFVLQFYSGLPYIPGELLVEEEPEDGEALETWLSEKAGHRVHIRVPKRGEKHAMLDIAKRNAELTLSQFGTRLRQEEKRTKGAMEELCRLIDIYDEELPPSRVEAYDISNTYGFLSVGSMVVFQDGRPWKNEYRKFRIKTVVGSDDYESLREVLRRRFSHAFSELSALQKEGKSIAGGKFTHLPDLILMDGGRGQVNIALEVLEELGIYIPVAGMVKDDHHNTRGLYFNNKELPIDKDSEGFKLITRMQDEAHRFAIEYHRSIRSKTQVRSVLDDIPGIGEKRRKALMMHFASIEEIKEADISQLMEVPGIRRHEAEAIIGFFRKS